VADDIAPVRDLSSDSSPAPATVQHVRVSRQLHRRAISWPGDCRFGSDHLTWRSHPLYFRVDSSVDDLMLVDNFRW